MGRIGLNNNYSLVSFIGWVSLVFLPCSPAASRLQFSSLLFIDLYSFRPLSLLTNFIPLLPKSVHSFCSLSLQFSPESILFPKSYPFSPCSSLKYFADICFCVHPCLNYLKILPVRFSLTFLSSRSSSSLSLILTTEIRKRDNTKEEQFGPILFKCLTNRSRIGLSPHVPGTSPKRRYYRNEPRHRLTN